MLDLLDSLDSLKVEPPAHDGSTINPRVYDALRGEAPHQIAKDQTSHTLLGKRKTMDDVPSTNDNEKVSSSS